MSRLSPHHTTLTDGEGKCSVPMWTGDGCPAGFCDKPAYGERPPSGVLPGPYWDPGAVTRVDGRYPGYVPGLACQRHGGPSLADLAPAGGLITKDGNKWCATGPGFINLAESPAGFGDTPAEATADYYKEAAR